MAKKHPEFISIHKELMDMANQYNAITRESIPNMTERVAAKEELVAEMSAYIQDNNLLLLGVLAFNPGLRAGFARAIGEAAVPGQIVYVALRAYTATTGPKDYNLKHQIVRAWSTLHDRFPDNPDIARQVEADLRHLEFGADQCLLDTIGELKSTLGIS